MLPTFVVIGAQKAGTTSLYHYLSAHPQVALPVKEPDFFAVDSVWARGLGWYESLFAGLDDVPAVGEASPSYTMYPAYPHAAERLGRTLPHARLVYVLRDPVERMRSSYQHALATGFEHRPLAAAITDERYLAPSRYATQLERHLRWFPESQVLVVTSEELKDERAATLRRVYRFLDVEEDPPAVDLGTELHRSSEKRVPRAWARRLGDLVIRRGWERRLPNRLVEMRARDSVLLTRPFRSDETRLTAEQRERLADVLHPDVVRLRKWLGDDFPCWGLA